METKQDKDPYIWNYNIKIKTQQGTYDYEEETKVKVKKIEDRRLCKNKKTQG